MDLAHYHTAELLLQPYLQDIFNWTKTNDLILNPDKSTATLFTPDTHEHNVTLNLTINNVIIPTVKNPKILGLTLDPSFNFGDHSKITKEKADSSIRILKALTSTSWGKQKETLFATYLPLSHSTCLSVSFLLLPFLHSMFAAASIFIVRLLLL